MNSKSIIHYNYLANSVFIVSIRLERNSFQVEDVFQKLQVLRTWEEDGYVRLCFLTLALDAFICYIQIYSSRRKYICEIIRTWICDISIESFIIIVCIQRKHREEMYLSFHRQRSFSSSYFLFSSLFFIIFLKLIFLSSIKQKDSY